MLDTGGLDLASKEDLTGSIRAQVNQAIKEADALLFVVDLRAAHNRGYRGGRVTSQDCQAADPAANKADTAQHDSKIADFYGLASPMSIGVRNARVGDWRSSRPILELKASARDEVLEADLDESRQSGMTRKGSVIPKRSPGTSGSPSPASPTWGNHR